jgi:hypothetical protein
VKVPEPLTRPAPRHTVAGTPSGTYTKGVRAVIALMTLLIALMAVVIVFLWSSRGSPRTTSARVVCAGPLIDLVADCGAVADGSADTTAAFQAACDGMPVTGGKIRLSPGSFRLLGSVTCRGEGLTIEGQGQLVTNIVVDLADYNYALNVHNAEGFVVRDVGCQLRASASRFLQVFDSRGTAIERVRCVGPNVNPGDKSVMVTIVAGATYSTAVRIDKITCLAIATCVMPSGVVTASTVVNSTFFGNQAPTPQRGSAAVWINPGVTAFVVSNSVIEGFDIGIVDYGSHTRVYGNTFEHMTTGACSFRGIGHQTALNVFYSAASDGC